MLTKKKIKIQFGDFEWKIKYTHDDDLNVILIDKAVPILDDHDREAIVDIIEEEE